MRFLDRLRKFERPAPPEQITLNAIGRVRNAVRKPRPKRWEEVESRIELAVQHRERLRGLDDYSHVLVVVYLDLAAAAPEKPVTLTVESVDVGIFATRSQLRPNHLGVSAVPLLGVEEGVVRVRGLDAIDGTPVLDLKPYLPHYDSHPDATIPGGG